jgi:hypothetical protein
MPSGQARTQDFSKGWAQFLKFSELLGSAFVWPIASIFSALRIVEPWRAILNREFRELIPEFLNLKVQEFRS